MCIPPAMAQKQSRVEKLLKSLNENDVEKLQKGREKLDEETADAYSDEVALIDAMHQLWNKKSEEAVPVYFGYYDKATRASFPDICREQKIDLTALHTKTDKVIVEILEASKDKISFSRILIDSIHKVSYPMDEAILQKIVDVREFAFLENMEKLPTQKMYDMYSKEYPNGRFKQQMRTAGNALLYRLVKESPTEDNFKAFFENTDMLEFFKEKGGRAYLPEVCSIYDEYLYQTIITIEKEGNAADIKKCIEHYKNSVYLKDVDKKHLKDIEYLNEKVDFELLKPAVANAEGLKLVKDFLLTHKYKEFRDKANALRSQFEAQVIESTPTSVKFYNQGLLMKCNETMKDKTISTTYSYNDKGQPASILILTEVKDQSQDSSEVQTNMFYDMQGRCALEIQINPKTKTELYRRTRSFSPEGIIKSDSLKYTDGRLVLSAYDNRGRLLEAKEFGRNGDILSFATNKYNEKGWKIESQQQNMASAGLFPNQVISQKDKYEYNDYGYLIKLSYQRILGNNEKTSGSLIYLYDEYGNVIDGNSYYEYDDTGRWICKTNRNNPAEVERIQYFYK